MKYCLSSRMAHEYLRKADEIKVAYNDRNVISDLLTKYPKARIILSLPADAVDWKEIEDFNNLAKGELVIDARSKEQIYDCKNHNIEHFYYHYPITCAYDLRAVKDLGVCYALIDAPLFFNMPFVKQMEVPIRVHPSLAHYDYLPHEDGGVCGSWIRPEDTELYEDYIQVFEFEGESAHREEALFHIYAENKYWDRETSEIITNLHATGNNTLFLNSFAKCRLACKQVCAESRDRCSICYNTMFLADKNIIGKLKEKYE